MENIRQQCSFKNCNDVYAEGLRGGLSLGWNEGIDIIMSFFKTHINIKFDEKDGSSV